MINYNFWCQDISKENCLKIIEKSTICSENDYQYNEEFNELYILTNQKKLPNINVDDIFQDLEGILDKKFDCHIKVRDAKSNKISVIQKDGIRTIEWSTA